MKDAAELELLVRVALAGDRKAFARLTLDLWPLVEASVRGVSTTELGDERQELFARLLARLEHDDYRGLRAFDAWKARHPEKDFLDWTRIVLANLSRDRARERRGRRPNDTTSNAIPSAKRLLNELASLEPLDSLGYRPPITTNQTAREILEYAAEHLPPLQARALGAWIEGESFDALCEKTGLETEAAAVRLVRAALATLRRQFVIDE